MIYKQHFPVGTKVYYIDENKNKKIYGIVCSKQDVIKEYEKMYGNDPKDWTSGNEVWAYWDNDKRVRYQFSFLVYESIINQLEEKHKKLFI